MSADGDHSCRRARERIQLNKQSHPYHWHQSSWGSPHNMARRSLLSIFLFQTNTKYRGNFCTHLSRRKTLNAYWKAYPSFHGMLVWTRQWKTVHWSVKFRFCEVHVLGHGKTGYDTGMVWTVSSSNIEKVLEKDSRTQSLVEDRNGNICEWEGKCYRHRRVWCLLSTLNTESPYHPTALLLSTQHQWSGKTHVDSHLIISLQSRIIHSR